MRRVAMRLAYDGSLFHGWQVQHHCDSVEARLGAALAIVARQPIQAYGAGRTDAGVHALNQVAHCDLPAGIDLLKLRASLNALAAPGIVVKDVVAVPAHFHARHSATGKVYRYLIFNRPYPPLFAAQCCWWIRPPLDLAAMRAAARQLVGTHDFSAFRAARCEAPSPVRTLARIKLAEEERAEATLRIELEANGFLQHMARIITGTLAAVGLGKLAPEAIPAILASRKRARAAMTAPAKGLHLARVLYDLDAFPELAAWADA
jgi:tRNA pseudouridine38-40 synthase